MSGVRIDALPAGSALTGTEAFPGMTGSVAYRWTPAQFTTYVKANLDTITTGTWQGSPIGVLYGGTGLTALGSGSMLVGSGATMGTIPVGEIHQNLVISDQTDRPAWENPRIPQVSKNTAYTFVLSDGGKHFLHPSADTTPRTWTIPANSSVAFPIGSTLTFINQNAAGTLTIAITTDTMRLAGAGTAGSRTLTANGIATAIKIASTEWMINGAGLT